MGENKINSATNWPLIEHIARLVYRNKMAALTELDIKEIESSIDRGDPIIETQTNIGEMNFDAQLASNVVLMGLAAIQVIMAYLQWGHPKHTFVIRIKNEPQTEDDEQIKPSDILKVIDLLIPKVSPPLQKELIRQRDNYPKVISSQLKVVKTTDIKSDAKE